MSPQITQIAQKAGWAKVDPAYPWQSRTSGLAAIRLKYPPNEWQIVDDRGYVMPWYADTFLRRLINWDVSGWRVLEIGAGYSTLWWASRCRALVSLEQDPDWSGPVRDALDSCGLANADLISIVAGGYVRTIRNLYGSLPFNCVIVDAGDRIDCLHAAVSLLREGGVLIVDNSEEIEPAEMPSFLKHNERHDFPTTGHPFAMTTYWIVRQWQAFVGDPNQCRTAAEHPEWLRMAPTGVERP